MKFQRLLILAAAAWAGTWFYKLQYVSPADGDSAQPATSRSADPSLYSDIAGPGSLAGTVRSSANSRTGNSSSYNNSSSSSNSLIPTKNTSAGPGKVGKSKPVEDISPDDVDLLQAAAKGDKNLVERRLSAHVKIDSRDTSRRTPLMYAAWNGNDDIANRLLAAGANPEFKDRYGNNVFDFAATRGLTDTLQFLLQRTNTTDDRHYAEYAAVMQATYMGDPSKLPVGTGKLTSVNHINPEGQAPLHIASGNGSLALMQALMRRGADINITNEGRQTPLHWAAWNNQAQAVQLLLSQGADITLTDFAGNTPLILAAQNGSTQAAQVLLDKGADRYVANKEGKTAAIVAEDKGFTALAKMLQ